MRFVVFILFILGFCITASAQSEATRKYNDEIFGMQKDCARGRTNSFCPEARNQDQSAANDVGMALFGLYMGAHVAEARRQRQLEIEARDRAGLTDTLAINGQPHKNHRYVDCKPIKSHTDGFTYYNCIDKLTNKKMKMGMHTMPETAKLSVLTASTGKNPRAATLNDFVGKWALIANPGGCGKSPVYDVGRDGSRFFMASDLGVSRLVILKESPPMLRNIDSGAIWNFEGDWPDWVIRSRNPDGTERCTFGRLKSQ